MPHATHMPGLAAAPAIGTHAKQTILVEVVIAGLLRAIFSAAFIASLAAT